MAVVIAEIAIKVYLKEIHAGLTRPASPKRTTPTPNR